jgi:hypothetical protein
LSQFLSAVPRPNSCFYLSFFLAITQQFTAYLRSLKGGLKGGFATLTSSKV